MHSELLTRTVDIIHGIVCFTCVSVSERDLVGLSSLVSRRGILESSPRDGALSAAAVSPLDDVEARGRRVQCASVVTPPHAIESTICPPPSRDVSPA
jgi:hypothetical protein